MPPKKQIPAPIDRPVSRAYLRNFTGWSTAYPPGMSDPTSCRLMENMMVNRDGSMRIRPGLRYLSYKLGADGTSLIANDRPCVGTHEPFFLNDGTKAYLFAVVENDGTVGFRVLARPQGAARRTVYKLTDPAIGFTIETPGSLPFTAATTYVKYLQIDNKIFAMSNQGEPFRMFVVDSSKTAKVLAGIMRPDWTVADKLTVVHPTQAWINGNAPTYTRTNRIVSPSMDGILGWTPSKTTALVQTQEQTQTGAWSVRLGSLPTRTNLMPNPLDGTAPGNIALTGWGAGLGVNTIERSGQSILATLEGGGKDRHGQVFSPDCDVDPQTAYQVALDWGNDVNVENAGVLLKWFTSTGAQIGDPITKEFGSLANGRKIFNNISSPKSAATLRIWVWADAKAAGLCTYLFNNVLVSAEGEPTSAFSGDDGKDYYWGTAGKNASKSFYHPSQDVSMSTMVDPVTVKGWVAYLYVRARQSQVRSCWLSIDWIGADGTLSSITGTAVNDSASSWTQLLVNGTAPTGTTKARVTLHVAAVTRTEWHYADSAMFETGSAPDPGGWFCGATPDAADGTTKNSWDGDPQNSISYQQVFTAPGIPLPAPNTTDTLISSDKTANVYSFGFFYTFANEIGESAASQITVVKTQRSWAMLKWETANAQAEPSGTATNDPTLCADQLVAYLPQDAFTAAVDQGATHWNLYVFTWSDQDPVPVTAVRVDEQPIDKVSHPYASNGSLRLTPNMTDTGDEAMVLPSAGNRYNYSKPPAVAQGLVCADRMVVVGDVTDPAKVRWTSNQQGSYTDFSAIRGGGYKTLTSGNLYVAACVKLWQNPQSVDTITILCMGTDGYSTGYYMAPATVNTSSEAVEIMGFEETTATPGTTSPFGCEVMNNALFHPLEEQVMVSRATMYNINHNSITNDIQNEWIGLGAKQRIVSCQHDNRIYWLVFNPDGPDLPDGCMGNEVWVYDGQTQGGGQGTWSRWTTPGCSLRKVEQGGRVYVSLIHPDGIFYFDEYYPVDDYVSAGRVYYRNIDWMLETNTQGANRAHDAWAHLQQVNVTLGNFQGAMRYGIRGVDVHGMLVDVSKVVGYHSSIVGDTQVRSDLEDFLLIRRDMKEWVFYAHADFAMDDTFGKMVSPSFGQISFVQYRYTPVSVNVGTEFGSVETFEYGRLNQHSGADQLDYDTYSVNGIPRPYIDIRSP